MLQPSSPSLSVPHLNPFAVSSSLLTLVSSLFLASVSGHEDLSFIPAPLHFGPCWPSVRVNAGSTQFHSLRTTNSGILLSTFCALFRGFNKTEVHLPKVLQLIDYSGSQHVNADWTQETQVPCPACCPTQEPGTVWGSPSCPHEPSSSPSIPVPLSFSPLSSNQTSDLPLNLPLSLLSRSPSSLSLASHPITSWVIHPQLWAQVLNPGDADTDLILEEL